MELRELYFSFLTTHLVLNPKDDYLFQEIYYYVTNQIDYLLKIHGRGKGPTIVSVEIGRRSFAL